LGTTQLHQHLVHKPVLQHLHSGNQPLVSPLSPLQVLARQDSAKLQHRYLRNQRLDSLLEANKPPHLRLDSRRLGNPIHWWGQAVHRH
jgi:hypothetical protein